MARFQVEGKCDGKRSFHKGLFSSKNKNKEKVLQPREKLIIPSGTTTKKTSASSLFIFKQVEGMSSLTAHLPQARLS